MRPRACGPGCARRTPRHGSGLAHAMAPPRPRAPRPSLNLVSRCPPVEAESSPVQSACEAEGVGDGATVGWSFGCFRNSYLYPIARLAK